MAKFKHLTTEERKIIIKLNLEGRTCREIGELFNKSHTAIAKVIKIFNDEQRIDEKKRPGRPRVTDKRTDRRINCFSSSDPFMSAVKIRGLLHEEGKCAPSVETIRRRLRENGKNGRVARKIHFINKINRQKRLNFYYEHVLKDQDFWYKILWTDESMIRMRHSHGRMYVWRSKDQEFSYECTQHTLKSLDKGIMIWGCFSAYGIGKIVCLEGKVDAKIYLNLLKKIIIPEGKRLIGEDFILQQDNAPIHKAKIVQEYLKNQKVNVLDWPPQSPDLSPIENVWSWLKMEISKNRPKSLQELKECTESMWVTFSSESCRKYALSLPSRLTKMSRNNGGHSGY